MDSVNIKENDFYENQNMKQTNTNIAKTKKDILGFNPLFFNFIVIELRQDIYLESRDIKNNPIFTNFFSNS